MTTLAVFDFDGTITSRDSMVGFLRSAVPARRGVAIGASLLPAAIGYWFGRRDRTQLKEQVLTRFFGGMPLPEFERLAGAFANYGLPRIVRRAALERLHWHVMQRHRVVINTASLEAYVAPWARRNGIGDVLGTRLEVDGWGRLTGRLLGANCNGSEKVARLEALIGDLKAVTLYAYGDSRGDRELLAVATYASYRPFRRSQLALSS